jgi:O-antigen/teichoic acid export membrane protein
VSAAPHSTLPDPVVETPAEESLSRRTLDAGTWKSAASLIQGGLQFGVGVLLARLLPPEDFGLVALALIVTGFTAIVADLGLATAIVRIRPLTDRHLRVALTASLLFGLTAALVVSATAPAIGSWIEVAELPPVLRLASLAFVLHACGATARALLRRRLDFRRLFHVEVGSYVVGYALVATTLALAGFGAWSLVWGSLVQAAIGSAAALWFAPTLLRPLLARAELGALLGYGTGVSLNSVVNYAARNVDNLLVGRLLGTGVLGLYSRAYNLMVLPLFYVSSVTGSVLFPALSEIQTDRERMGRAYLLTVQLVTLLVAPVMIGMLVAAPFLVVGVYGPAWAGAVLPLQILCAVGLFRAVYDAATAVTHASGHVFAELARQAGYAVLVLVGAGVGARWGIGGVAAGVSVAVIFMYVAMAQLSLRITGCGWRAFARAQAPGILVAAGVGLLAGTARLVLQAAGVGDLGVFAGILAACAIAYPFLLARLPERLRPVPLFEKLDLLIVRLPLPIRPLVARIFQGRGG